MVKNKPNSKTQNARKSTLKMFVIGIVALILVYLYGYANPSLGAFVYALLIFTAILFTPAFYLFFYLSDKEMRSIRKPKTKNSSEIPKFTIMGGLLFWVKILITAFIFIMFFVFWTSFINW